MKRVIIFIIIAVLMITLIVPAVAFAEAAKPKQTRIAVNKRVDAKISVKGEQDFYKFTTGSERRIKLILRAGKLTGSKLIMKLYSPQNELLKTLVSSTGKKERTITLKRNTDYTLKVYIGGGKNTGSYRIKLEDGTVPSPISTFKLQPADKGEITSRWSASSYADGYEVYRRAAGGRWSKLCELDSDARSYTDAYLNQGKLYYYRVRGIKRTGGVTKKGSFTPAASCKPGIFTEAEKAQNEAELEKYFKDKLPLSYKLEEGTVGAKRLWQDIASNIDDLKAVKRSMKSDITSAWKKLTAKAAKQGIAAGKMTCELPDWRQLGIALCYGKKCYRSSYFTVAAELTQNNAGEVRLYLTVTRLSEKKLIEKTDGNDPKKHVSAVNAYAYIKTFLRNNGMMDGKAVEPQNMGYLAKTGLIAAPVNKGWVRKTWMAPRDNGTRYHAGTDILLGAKEPIFSCTPGTVIGVGYEDMCGNFVVVRDKYGYEYHYYHMIRLSEFVRKGDKVKKGQRIGSVGNTGNSARDHLHLTIVHPDYIFVNPYDYCLKAVHG